MTTLTNGASQNRHQIEEAYGSAFLSIIDTIERGDMYGVVTEGPVHSLTEKMNIDTSSRVLDLCCGIGGPARLIAKKYGSEVVGVDISEFNIQEARKRTQQANLSDKVRFQRADVLDLTFKDESFTHVFGCDAWVYIQNKGELYQQAAKLLVADGILGFTDFRVLNPKNTTYWWENIFGTHYIETAETYENLLQTSGFTILDHTDITRMAIDGLVETAGRMIARRDALHANPGPQVYCMMHEFIMTLVHDYIFGNLRHGGYMCKKQQ